MKLAIRMIFVLVLAACGGGSNNGSHLDGGGRGSGSGGGLALGDNASVPQTCQTCLSGSTKNECATKGKECTDDPDCAKLDTCINNCSNINAGCIANCADGASQNAIDEWNAWSDCDCGTCAMQCNQTFCNIGSGSGSGSNACLPDDQSCSTTTPCCTFCASDNYCGCIPSGNSGCQSNGDCCSNSCDGGGTCR